MFFFVQCNNNGEICHCKLLCNWVINCNWRGTLHQNRKCRANKFRILLRHSASSVQDCEGNSGKYCHREESDGIFPLPRIRIINPHCAGTQTQRPGFCCRNTGAASIQPSNHKVQGSWFVQALKGENKKQASSQGPPIATFWNLAWLMCVIGMIWWNFQTSLPI